MRFRSQSSSHLLIPLFRGGGQSFRTELFELNKLFATVRFYVIKHMFPRANSKCDKLSPFFFFHAVILLLRSSRNKCPLGTIRFIFFLNDLQNRFITHKMIYFKTWTLVPPQKGHSFSYCLLLRESSPLHFNLLYKMLLI